MAIEKLAYGIQGCRKDSPWNSFSRIVGCSPGVHTSMLRAPLPRLSERKVLSANFDFISLIFTFGEPLLITPDVPRGGAYGQ